ncbi:MAG: hypothetical protein R3F11_13025 [Verrucomicrobiales bacterium]
MSRFCGVVAPPPAVTLHLAGVPMRQALDLAAAKAGYQVEFEPPSRVVLRPLPADPPEYQALVAASIPVPESFSP